MCYFFQVLLFFSVTEIFSAQNFPKFTKNSLFAAMCLMVALVLAGCQSTPDKRIAKESEAFMAMPAATQEKIRAGEVAVGFTETQVRLARGKPDRIVHRTTAEGEWQVWTYERRGAGMGFGLVVGGGSRGLGGGVGMSTGGRSREVLMRVILTDGVVTAVENYDR